MEKRQALGSLTSSHTIQPTPQQPDRRVPKSLPVKPVSYRFSIPRGSIALAKLLEPISNLDISSGFGWARSALQQQQKQINPDLL
ncbi:hypothetical protein WJX74_004535 [Apatococcus lobatus]|uniref:Uncharacterized protein n=1 Tax=Apatococcus lobatus TaxID=904363 RepID=A0AAW1QUT2_9CHLO